MHWKFYELEKFKESNQYAKIKEYDKLDEHSEGYLLKERFEWLKDNLKEQWLEFLVECNSQLEMPNRNELIKKGYNIMKLATWDPKDQVLYWKQKQNEIDAIQQKEFDKEEAFNQGKWKGEVKGEIKQIKFGLKYKMDEEKIVEDLKFLKKDNFPYIKEHLDETESQIMGGMDIEYQNDL